MCFGVIVIHLIVHIMYVQCILYFSMRTDDINRPNGQMCKKKKTDIIQQLEQAALIKKMAGRFSIEKLKRLDRGNEQCESDRREQINNPLQSPATRNV